MTTLGKAAPLQHSLQPLDLLSQWQWDHLDHDSFTLFALRQQLLQALIGQTDDACTQIQDKGHLKHAWIVSAIHAVFDSSRMSTKNGALQMYFEVFHAIFKDFRKCDLAPDHPGYTLLTGWMQHPNTSAWLSLYFKNYQHDNLALVPLLVCLNDVIKIAKLCHDQELYPGESQWAFDLFAEHLHEICSFWQHTSISVVRRSLEIIARLLRCPLLDGKKEQTILDLLLAWKERLKEHITEDDFWALYAPDRTEFYYEASGDGRITVDRECLKLGMQVVVSSFLYLSGCPYINVETQRIFDQLKNSIIVGRRGMSDLQVLEAVLEIYGSNDEDTVNLQLDVLRMFKNLDSRNGMENFKQSFKQLLEPISPNRLFLCFCQRTGMDHELLVDLLLSDETDFLQLFVDYLKHVEHNPDDFVIFCCNILEEDIREAMGMLHRLVRVLQAGGFPYNPSYLIQRLNLVLKLIQDAAIRQGRL